MKLLDGSSGTFLKGYFNVNIEGSLWSAKALMDPIGLQATNAMHEMYVDCGASIISSLTYQISLPTCLKAGYSAEEAEDIFLRGLDQVFAMASKKSVEVAVCLGSYGCSLPDCAEFSGSFGDASELEIMEFHRWRLNLVQKYVSDKRLSKSMFYIAFETIPSLLEVQAICRLIEESFPDIGRIWVSLYPAAAEISGPAAMLGNGVDSIESAIAALSGSFISGIGINCCDPFGALSIVRLMRQKKQHHQFVVCYANGKDRKGNLVCPQQYGKLCSLWCQEECEIIGGCCYTTPDHVRNIMIDDPVESLWPKEISGACFFTPEMLQKFHTDGFLVIPNFLSEKDLAELKHETEVVVETLYDADNHPLTLFSTERDQDAQAKAAYFMESGDKIRFFFEEKAMETGSGKGKLLVSNPLMGLNKIGHGLHLHNERFRLISHGDPRIVSILKDLQYKKPIVLQSMVILKQAGVGSNVIPHQDSTFLYTHPQSAIGFWFALDDCDESNGTLSFYPGSHKRYPFVKSRFIRDPVGKGEAIKVGPDQREEWTSREAKITVKVARGSLVLIHGSVVHESGPNESERGRNAYTFHCIEGSAQYSEDNWLQSDHPEMFTPLYME